MDGLETRLNGSIQGQLSLWLSLVIVAVGVAAGVFSYRSAYDEANEFQDDLLRQVGTMFERHRLPVPFAADASGPGATAALSGDEAPQMQVQALDPAAPAASGPAPLALPLTLAPGFHTLALTGGAQRVYVTTSVAGQRLAVSQPQAVRDIVARETALHATLPFTLLLPLLLLAVRYVVRRLFRSVTRLAAEIDRRSEQSLHPLATEALAAEIRPFVAAINLLLARVQRAMEAQQRFVADAAHELRSPLTALSLQIERLAKSPMTDDASERVQALREAVARSRQLLEQLLALARAQAPSAPPGSPTGSEPREPVALSRVLRQLLEERMPLIEAKSLDLGVTGSDELHLRLPEADLHMLMSNLLDNAIRYTSAQGAIELACHRAGADAVLQLCDSGPGIAPAERERVFDPFYRVLGSGEIGSGLGLSIVRSIAERWGATVTLDWADAQAQRGLCVTVHLPGAVVGRPTPHQAVAPASMAKSAAVTQLDSSLPR